jgi:putative ABC transport system substrate-binding protein
MRRREVIKLLAGAAAWPLASHAQESRPRIGALSINSAQGDAKVTASFVDGLRALGYVEGRTVDIDFRYADGDPSRLTPLAQELIALKPDVAFVNSISPALAMRDIAPTLPIVCAGLGNASFPILAASHARPGGSVTGVASDAENLYAKLLELALDLVPGASRIGFLANPGGGSIPLYKKQIEAGAQARGVTVLTLEARTAEEIDVAYAGFVREQVQAVIVPANGLFNTNDQQIAQLALAARLPTIVSQPRNVEAGGLASYGVDLSENFRRAAVYVDKILKGAKPGDLPIEFPTKLLLVLNLKTAKALGVSIPPTMIGRADEVVE